VDTVGLSSGASVPELLVTEVVQWLAERGYGELDEVSHTEERLAFALPQELRRDLKLTTKSS
jgi:4-hydroxy-3-methylbut-2-enyl diphosphate reductase